MRGGLARREAHRPLAGPLAEPRRAAPGRAGARRRAPRARRVDRARCTTPVSPSSTRSRTPPTGTVTIAQPAICASISTPGSPSASLVRMNTSIAAEDLRDVVAVAEHVHVTRRARGPRRRARTRSRSGPSPATTRCAGSPSCVHRGQRVERAVGSLLLDQVPDESDQPDVVRRSRARRAGRAPAASRSTASERLRVAEVRDRPDRPGEAEAPELVAEVGRERDGRVDAAHDRAPAEARGPAATSAAGNRGCVATRSAGGRGGARAPRPRPRGLRARSRCRPVRARGDGAAPARRAASARTPPSARRVSGGRSASSLPSKPSPSASTRLA